MHQLAFTKIALNTIRIGIICSIVLAVTEQAVGQSLAAPRAAPNAKFLPETVDVPSTPTPPARPFIEADPPSVDSMESIIASASPANTQLGQLEALAFENNPAIRQARARRDALMGKRIQVGLRPNPVAGIRGEDIFEDGAGGRYGFFYGQEIVRGNKLTLSRRIVAAEIKAAGQQIEVLQQRLKTDVCAGYYNVLVAQQRVQLTSKLVAMMQEIVDMSEALVRAQEAAQTTVLQAEIELERVKVIYRQADNDLLAARQQMAALLNQADLPFGYLTGDATETPAVATIETLYDQLLSQSPELATELAKIETAKRSLERANVQWIPNVTWQGGVGYDTTGEHVVADFQIGMPLPKYDVNQGQIMQRRHEIAAAQANVEKMVLRLRQRLVVEYRAYVKAKIQVDAFSNSILPKSEKTLELISAGYREGEVGFLQVLTAQRTYFEAQLEYLDRLQQLRNKAVLLDGQLLSGSLN